MNTLYPFPRFLSLVTLTATLATACVGEVDPTTAGSSAAINAGQLDEKLELGETRIEIELAGDGVSVHEIEVYPATFLVDEEYVESTVKSIDAATGTLTLDLGGLSIAISEGARFRTPEESNADRGAWFAAVEAALAAGQPVFVRAVRPAPASPQAPEDGTFVASELRLESEVEEAQIEINVDGDNLEAQADAGTLAVLGMKLDVTSSTFIHDADDSDDSPDDGLDDSLDGGLDDDGLDDDNGGPDHSPEIETEDGTGHT